MMLLTLVGMAPLAACDAVFPYESTIAQSTAPADRGAADAGLSADAPFVARDAPALDDALADVVLPPGDSAPPDTGLPDDALLLPPDTTPPDTSSPVDAQPVDGAPQGEAGGNCYPGTTDCSGCPVGLSCIDPALLQSCRCSSAGTCTMGPCFM